MTQTGYCTQCGADLVEGNCPACLFKLGLTGAVPVFDPPTGSPAPAPALRKRRDPVWVVIAAIVVSAIGLLVFLRSRGPVQRNAFRLSIQPPSHTEIGALAVSPDGSAVAFAGTSGNGETRLWVRRFDAMEAVALAETEGAAFPFWSPDSQRVGFFAEGALKRIAARGGFVQRICAAPNGRGGTWSSDGTIVFAASGSAMLSRVNASGGEPVPAMKTELRGSQRWPSLLPGERAVLFTLRSPAPDEGGIYVADLKSGKHKRILDDLSNAAYTDRHLLFARSGTLMAQPYDAAKHLLRGDAFVVADQVGYSADQMYAAFSAAAGRLVFDQWGPPAEDQLTWLDRTGRRLGTIGEPGLHSRPVLSPDERYILAGHRDRNGRSDLWLHDFERGTASRLTMDQRSSHGVWSPDGRRIAFASHRAEAPGIYEMDARGGGPARLLLQTATTAYPTSWSPDGRYLLYQAIDANGNWDLWVLPTSGEAKARPAFLATAYNEQNGAFSPDGRWIAYDSDESGRREVFVQAFESERGKRMVSANGASHPYWGREGGELFYLSADREMMAVAMDARESLQAGHPRPLFAVAVPDASAGFAVRGNGEQFLIPIRIGAPDATLGATVLLNWFSLVRPEAR